MESNQKETQSILRVSKGEKKNKTNKDLIWLAMFHIETIITPLKAAISLRTE